MRTGMKGGKPDYREIVQLPLTVAHWWRPLLIWSVVAALLFAPEVYELEGRAFVFWPLVFVGAGLAALALWGRTLRIAGRVIRRETPAVPDGFPTAGDLLLGIRAGLVQLIVVLIPLFLLILTLAGGEPFSVPGGALAPAMPVFFVGVQAVVFAALVGVAWSGSLREAWDFGAIAGRLRVQWAPFVILAAAFTAWGWGVDALTARLPDAGAVLLLSPLRAIGMVVLGGALGQLGRVSGLAGRPPDPLALDPGARGGLLKRPG